MTEPIELPECLLKRRRNRVVLYVQDFIPEPQLFVGFDSPPPAFILRRHKSRVWPPRLNDDLVRQLIPTPLPACPGSVEVTQLGAATVEITARADGLGFADSSGTVIVTQVGVGSVTVQGKGCIT